MPRLLLTIFFLAFTAHAGAQHTIPFLFTSEDDNTLIRDDDSLKYYVATGDTEDVVVINDDASWYQLLDKNKQLIAEGAFITDGDKYLQDGKWVENFENGKVKNTGNYHHGLPIGTWTMYHISGKVKRISNYGMFSGKGGLASCLSGSYQEFYTNGKVKESGFYSASIVSLVDTVKVEDPVTGQDTYNTVPRTEMKPVKIGHWEYYTEDGELDRKEDL